MFSIMNISWQKTKSSPFVLAMKKLFISKQKSSAESAVPVNYSPLLNKRHLKCFHLMYDSTNARSLALGIFQEIVRDDLSLLVS